MNRVLVAGVGNIFLGDDGFGVEVARRLGAEDLPEGARVEDFGIRGVHLALELLEGYETLILVDAVAGGEAPGTVTVRERTTTLPTEERAVTPADGHDLDPESVLAMLAGMGGKLERLLVVGCEPANLAEGIGLSPPVAAAVPAAVSTVHRWVGSCLE